MANGKLRSFSVISVEEFIKSGFNPALAFRTIEFVDFIKDQQEALLALLNNGVTESFAGVGAGGTIKLSQSARSAAAIRAVWAMTANADGPHFAVTAFTLGADKRTITITPATTGMRIFVTYVPEVVETVAANYKAVFPAR